MTPQHSIDFCPVCGGGLCGVRICGLPVNDLHQDSLPSRDSNASSHELHALILCDECEAIWLEPDLSSDHVYVDPIESKCPVCNQDLWGPQSRWAREDDLQNLGLTDVVNRELDVVEDEGLA